MRRHMHAVGLALLAATAAVCPGQALDIGGLSVNTGGGGVSVGTSGGGVSAGVSTGSGGVSGGVSLGGTSVGGSVGTGGATAGVGTGDTSLDASLGADGVSIGTGTAATGGTTGTGTGGAAGGVASAGNAPVRLQVEEIGPWFSSLSGDQQLVVVRRCTDMLNHPSAYPADAVFLCQVLAQILIR